MDFSYINLLYKDFNTKKTAIEQYCKSVGDQAGAIYASVYEAVSLVKEKYEALSSSKTSTKRMPASSEFAVEDISGEKRRATEPESNSSADIAAIDENLSMTFSEISFRFQKEQKILQNLVSAIQEYQDIVNQTFAAWEQILEKKS